MGGVFTPGENKVRPGVYSTYSNIGTPAPVSVSTNTVGCVFDAKWGPFEPTLITRMQDATKYFGSAGTTEIIELALSQGARIMAVRLGSADVSAAAATKTMVDTTAVTPKDAVDLTAAYKGTRAIGFTLGDSPINANKREFKVYVDGTANWTLVETITIDAGASSYGGLGEGQGLVAAINANSEYLTAAWANDADNKVLAAVSSITALTGGVDVTAPDDTDYENALIALEGEEINVLVMDEDDHTGTIVGLGSTFVQEWFNSAGKRVIFCTGEPTTVAWATRVTHAAAINDEKVAFVGNGLADATATEYEGWKAAALVGGLIAVTPNNQSITHAIMSGYTTIIDALTNAEVEEALENGMIVFTRSRANQIQIEQGINTLVTPSASQDDGWKKIRRTRTRFELMDRCDAAIEPLIGRVNNDSAGRALMRATMQTQIQDMINTGKLSAGTASIDTSNPPRGDQAYFVLNVDDIDSMEKIYLQYGFRYSA